MKVPRLSLAPMAGYSDAAFREISRRWGAEVTYSEMISARAVLMGNARLPRDRCVIQLFGSDPVELGEAASLVEDRAEWIDLNAGCPVKKVVKRGAGAALLRDLSRLRAVVRGMRKHVKGLLSVKIRLGWDGDDAERIVSLLVEEGVDLVGVHARTAVQLYGGKAKREVFGRLKKRFGDLPILASGDVFSVEDVTELLNHWGVDGVLVARGAVGSPWIFEMARTWLEKKERMRISVEERRETVLTHLRLLAKDKGERRAVVEFRKFIAPYTKGMKGARELRRHIMTLEDYDAVFHALDDFFSTSSPDPPC